MPRKLTKILSFFLCFLLLFEQSGFAQVAGELDISGHLLQLRNSFLQDKFRPLHLRYLSYDSLNNNFKFLLDKGDFNKGLIPKKGTANNRRVEQYNNNKKGRPAFKGLSAEKGPTIQTPLFVLSY